MILATSITADYLERSQPFFESVCKYFPTHDKAGQPNRRLCFTISFATTIEGWECIETAMPECAWQPTNRPAYHSLQHGEFVKYLPYKENSAPDKIDPDDINPDDLICFIDSDMVLQRPFDLEFPSTRGILVTACSYPALSLRAVVGNLLEAGSGKPMPRIAKSVIKKYDIKEQYTEFCAGFIIATVASWENFYIYAKRLYPLLDSFKHHAAWQLLINLVALQHFPRVSLLPPHICNATWYEGTGMMADGSIFVGRKGVVGADGAIKDEVMAEQVYFKHTKFDT